MCEQEELIAQLKEGKEDAYRYLFDSYYIPLCRMANFYVGDIFVAENLVGDLLYYLWKERESFQVRTSLRGYLYTAIRNRSLNYLKQASKIHETNLSFLSKNGSDLEFPSGEFSSLVRLVGQELDEKIKDCVDTLPDECRAVFCMSRYDKLTYKEISDLQGISVNTVRYHIKNALATLRNKLKEYLE